MSTEEKKDIIIGGFKKRPKIEAPSMSTAANDFVSSTPDNVILTATKKKTEVGGAINARFPKDIWDKLSYFDTNIASRHESKNQFIVNAVEKELNRRIELFKQSL